MLRQIKVDRKENYYDKTFRGIDVDAVFADTEQKRKAATSVVEAGILLADVLLRLDDSHTVFYPPDRATKVDYRWTAAMIGDRGIGSCSGTASSRPAKRSASALLGGTITAEQAGQLLK